MDCTITQTTIEATISDNVILANISSTPIEVSLGEVTLQGSTAWGSITGDITDQTDLQTALNAKVDLAGDTMTGELGVPSIQFDITETGATAEGQLIWNTDKGLPEVQLAHNFDLEIGQQLVSRVVNKTGSTIAKGKIVYINGGQGNRPTVTLASNDTMDTSSKAYAVLAQDIANNGNGWAIVVGTLYNLNTAAYTAGQVLYLGTAGNFTATKPVAPAHLVTVAKVTNVHATQGVIDISIQNGFELNELHDVLITTPADGQVLKYNSTTGLWGNEEGGGDTSGLVPYTGATANVNLGTNDLSAQKVVISQTSANSIALKATIDGQDLLTVSNTSDGSFRLDATGPHSQYLEFRPRDTTGNTTIISNTGNFNTSFNGVFGPRFGAAVYPFLQSITSGQAVTILPHSAGSVVFDVRGASGQTANLQNWTNSSGTVLAYVSSSGVLGASTINQGVFGAINIVNNSGGGSYNQPINLTGSAINVTVGSNNFNVLDSSSNNRFTVLGTGNVGIGITSPTERLHVIGNQLITPTTDSPSTIKINTSFGNPAVQLGSYPGFPAYGGMWAGNITAGSANYAFISNGSSETIFNVPDSNGNLKFRAAHVDIGTINTSGMLLERNVSAGMGARMIVKNPATQAAGNEASYAFQINSNFSAPYYTAQVKSINTAASNANRLGFFLYLNSDGTPEGLERMTILDTGNVGIGVTPGEKLEVNGNVKAAKFIMATQQTYTVTNGTTDRSYDANATTIDELADVLGSLIADLKTVGVIA